MLFLHRKSGFYKKCTRNAQAKSLHSLRDLRLPQAARLRRQTVAAQTMRGYIAAAQSRKCRTGYTMTATLKIRSATLKNISILDKEPVKGYPIEGRGFCPISCSVSLTTKSTRALTKFRSAVIKTMVWSALSLSPFFFGRFTAKKAVCWYTNGNPTADLYC
jgi:hypothetical protein